MTYIPSPHITDASVPNGTLAAAKISGTALTGDANTFSNLMTFNGITSSSGASYLYNRYTSTPLPSINPSTGFHTIETASGSGTGSLILDHSANTGDLSNAGWILNIKNTRGAGINLTIDGSGPSNTVTATGSSGSNTITVTSSLPSNIQIGHWVTNAGAGTGIATGTQITNINSSTKQITLSANLAANLSGSNNVIFQSFIDYKSNSGNTGVEPKGRTLIISNNEIATLISNGIYWTRLR